MAVLGPLTRVLKELLHQAEMGRGLGHRVRQVLLTAVILYLAYTAVYGVPGKR